MAERAFQKLFSNTKITNFIFIYTQPKVGSTTLVSSLRISLCSTFNVIHIHDDIMLSVLTGIDDVSVNDIISYIAQKGYNIYVIDIYRTPIERKISEFFEKISACHFNNNEENLNDYTIKRISDRFNKLLPYLATSDNYFDKFNIGNPPDFDFDKKYTLQTVNNIKYIKLRLNDSSEWANILSTLLGRQIVLINDYTTESKLIGKLYNRFKTEYKIPTNYLESVKTCKYFNFYLSQEEREKYIDTWENKTSVPFVSYTPDEYKFYVNLYLENQYINDIQSEHYIDNGCLCSACSKKRTDIFNRAKQGENSFDKIIHKKAVTEFISDKANIILNKFKKNKVNTTSLKNVKNSHNLRLKFKF
jgi:hypothetical protein